MTIFSTGCPKGIKSRPSADFSDPKLLAKQVNDYLGLSQDRFDCAIRGFRYSVDYANKRITCHDSAGTNPDSIYGNAEARRIRNETIEDSLGVIDSLYMNFVSDLEGGRSTLNIVADVIDLGTGVAIGVTKGESALRKMGIALTGFRGARHSVDLNYFKEQTTPVLISQMDQNRADQYAVILLQMQKSPQDYGLRSAVRDIVKYFNAGTLIRAFTELTKTAAINTAAAEKKVLKIREIDPNDFVTVPENVRVAVNTFGKYRNSFSRTLAGGTQTEKDATREKLRLIYSEIYNDPTLRPVLDSVRTKRPDLATAMLQLEDTDVSVGRTVAGTETIKIISDVMTELDHETQSAQIILLKSIVEKHF